VTSTTTARVRALHALGEARALDRIVRDGGCVSVLIEADATQLQTRRARLQRWHLDDIGADASTLADLLGELLPSQDGRTFGPRVGMTGFDGDEQLVAYVLAADPEHLVLDLVVSDPDFPADADGNERALRWEATGRAGDTLTGLVALVVATAQADLATIPADSMPLEPAAPYDCTPPLTPAQHLGIAEQYANLARQLLAAEQHETELDADAMALQS